jgi:Planctomycete cytochrome C
MKGRLLLLAFAPTMTLACLQELDTDAALDPARAAEGDGQGSDASSWQACQSPSCDNANGTIPFLQQTPPIYLVDGSTTQSPCTDVESASMQIRATYCGSCHGPTAGAGQGGFNSVLDDALLVTSPTGNAQYPHFVVPGNPYGSYLYVAIAAGQMPPASTPPGPAPSAADLSVLYAWILACFPDAGGYVTGGGDYGPGGDAGVEGSTK